MLGYAVSSFHQLCKWAVISINYGLLLLFFCSAFHDYNWTRKYLKYILIGAISLIIFRIVISFRLKEEKIRRKGRCQETKTNESKIVRYADYTHFKIWENVILNVYNVWNNSTDKFREMIIQKKKGVVTGVTTPPRFGTTVCRNLGKWTSQLDTSNTSRTEPTWYHQWLQTSSIKKNALSQ